MSSVSCHFLRRLAMPALLALGGCAVGPDYQPTHTEVSNGWVDSPPAATDDGASSQIDMAQWWTVFHDSILTSLMQRAIASNLDLRQAESRILQARAARGTATSGFFPTLSTADSFTRSRTPPSGPGSTRNFFQAGLDAAWELDVFGGVRRGFEAAGADLEAAVEDRRDVLVTLTGEVAVNYLNLRGLQQQIVIARSNLKAQQHSADITRQRFQAGLIGALDVASADAQAATTASQVPVLESSARQTIYALSVLLALEPGALVQELAPTAEIPAAPPDVPVGLPSDLLRRRPDIRRAEAQIHAATARIGVATADLFPKFTLTGSLGFESDKLALLNHFSQRFWSFGPAMSWPIFDAGRIHSNIEVQRALREQSFLGYKKTVLTALQEVEAALIAHAKEQEHRQALLAAVTADRKAVDLATILYTEGQAEFLDVLIAQRSLYVAQDALVQSNRALSTDMVALYKALGGGWSEKDLVPAPPMAPDAQSVPETQPTGDK